MGKNKRKTDWYDLVTPEGRKDYFLAKAGAEISTLQNYFIKNRLIINMVGKKGSGKGTYTKMFLEALDLDAHHLSVGDLIRRVGIDHSTEKLLSTEIILSVLQKELTDHCGKTIFVDGFPRNVEQIDHAVKFSDVFVLINVPEAVIDQRMKGRTTCPVCQTPRDPKLLLTKHLEYEAGEYYLRCDNLKCNKARLSPKEGDKLGVEAIRERLNTDQKVIDHINNLNIKKINLSAGVSRDKKDLY